MSTLGDSKTGSGLTQLPLRWTVGREVNLGPEWCQRWRSGEHSWRHLSQGGFDRRLYDVGEIDERAAKAWVRAWHYSGTYPASALRFGLFDRGSLVGVAVLSVPVQRAVLTSVFPDFQPYVESLELGRFVLADRVPANGETFFLARVFDLAGKRGVRGVLAFSDPVARRRTSGEVVFVGHWGGIYQAGNAVYLGRTRARVVLLLPDGTVLNERAASKARSLDVGHEYVERQLRRFGAASRRDNESGSAWLERALREAGVRRLFHRGCHRYAWIVERPRRQWYVAGDLAYPKGIEEGGQIEQEGNAA